MAVLLSAGNQVPLMPLVEVVGNGDNTAPAQIGPTALKVGVTLPWLTVIVSVAVPPHWLGAGTNVYVVVAVLFKAGDQTPTMPLSEVVGNGDSAAPAQIAGTAANVGVTGLFTVIVKVAVDAHCPVFGVKV